MSMLLSDHRLLQCVGAAQHAIEVTEEQHLHVTELKGVVVVVVVVEFLPLLWPAAL